MIVCRLSTKQLKSDGNANDMEFLALLRLGKVQKSSILYTVTVWRSLIFVIYLFEKKKSKKLSLQLFCCTATRNIYSLYCSKLLWRPTHNVIFVTLFINLKNFWINFQFVGWGWRTLVDGKKLLISHTKTAISLSS